jgi:hypothetical protein
MAAVITAGLCGACAKGDDGVSPGNATLARRPNACVHVDPADFHPADFVSGITNPYLPFTPGTEYVYRSDDGTNIEETRTFITHDTRVIEGVTTTVVHDRVFTNGELTEDTFDWYAQDKDGNVWYFGEDTKELENGVVVSTEGSFEAGVNGAQAGIAMLACPRVGDEYRQEFAVGVAEDQGRVKNLAVDGIVVAFGEFDNTLQILETTPLEKGVREYKYYASGTGLVLEATPGGKARNELVEINQIP